MLDAQERRTGPRAPLTGTAVVHCRQAKVACEILDVGTMGIGLLAPREVPVGEFVRVVFRIGAANSRPFRAGGSRPPGADGGPERVQQIDGVVVVAHEHGTGYRLGIQFTVMEGQVVSQIHAYVAEQVSSPARRTGEYAAGSSNGGAHVFVPSEEAYAPSPTSHVTGEFPAADEPEASDVAATGTDDEEGPRGISGLPIRGPDSDAPIDRELLRLYLDAIRTVGSVRPKD
jgi:hypothetical protein